MSMEGNEPFIHCENLVKIFKVEDIEVVALQGLDLTVRQEEMMAIIGPSGSGKSSLLNVLGGLDTPSAGRAFVNGHDLLKMSQSDRLRYRRETIGFVWQSVGRNLIPYLTAVENVELPMILTGTFDRDRAHRLLDIVGLGERKHHQPRHMSGGEQQRVAIAIALANNPAVMLADEPTGSLDAENAANIVEAMASVREELGVTVIIVTHDQSLAESVDRYVSISDGKTSTESIRRYGALPSGRATNTAELRFEDGLTEESHEHHVLLDSAGRLQLSEETRSRYGIGRRVKMIEEDDRIVIVPPDEKESE